MKWQEYKAGYQLSNASIDEIAGKVSAFAGQLKMEKRNILRLRLTVEEILLKYQQRFSAEARCHIQAGIRLGRPYILLELEGEACDPFEKASGDYGYYSDHLLAHLGLSPSYSYDKGKNRLLFRLKKPERNPIIGLGLAIVAAVLVGAAGYWIPPGIKENLLTNILTPIYETFFDILGAIAGPMVFLSVAWGIYGIGDTATLGRIGKKMVLRYVGVVYLFTAAAGLLSLPFFRLNWAALDSGQEGLSVLFQMLLDIFPPNIISPFVEGNSLQIILLAVVIGIAMLVLGKQTEVVALAVEQINYLVQFLMELISKLVPAFVLIVLVQMIWSDTLAVVFRAWKLIVMFLAIAVLAVAVDVILAALRFKVRPGLLLRKGLPTFLIAVTTASSAAAFGTNISACEKRFGVNDTMTSFGVPLGMVIFAPGIAMYFLLTCLFMAEGYGVVCSAVWMVLAIFIAGILAIAAPPIPGGTLTCYTIMFLQLGIPQEALIVALAVDVLFDFIATGVNMFCLQLELIRQADRIAMLNKDILRKAD